MEKGGVIGPHQEVCGMTYKVGFTASKSVDISRVQARHLSLGQVPGPNFRVRWVTSRGGTHELTLEGFRRGDGLFLEWEEVPL